MFFIKIVCICILFMSGCSQEPYSLSEVNIEKTTETICYDIGVRVAGSKEEMNTATWLTDELIKLGYESDSNTLSIQKFSALDVESANLIAVYNPNPSLPLISIVTHYDSVYTSMGAGDNAVANGILLEIARFLTTQEANFSSEIRLVFLGSEENGYHGSKHYVETLSPSDRARHIGGYNMDISAAQLDDTAYLVCNTLGGMTTEIYVEGNFLEPVENAVAHSVRVAYDELYGEGYGGYYHMGESDQVSFNADKLDAANICWREIEDGLPVLPSEYHKETDTPEKLNYDTAVVTGRTVLCAIEVLLEAYENQLIPTNKVPAKKVESLAIDPHYSFNPDEMSPYEFNENYKKIYDGSQVSTYTIGEGTPFSNEVTTINGAQEGATIYIVAGVHGDEEGAWYAGNLLKKMSIQSGTVHILSPANTIGAMREEKRRFMNNSGTIDGNRRFPGDAKGNQGEQWANVIFKDIQRVEPDIVLDLHEARSKSAKLDFLGSSLIFTQLDSMEDLFMDMILDSEMGYLFSEPLNYYSPAPKGSINYAVTQELNIPTITVETFRGYDMECRISDHMDIVNYVLHHYNMMDRAETNMN